MEVAELGRHLWLQRVVDLVVERRRLLAVVGEGDLDALAERHRKVRVEPAALLRGGEHRVVRHRPAVGEPEEVEHRRRDARLLATLVAHLEGERPHPLGAGRRHREPDVADHAGSLEVGQHHALARLDAAVRCALAAAVGRAPRPPCPGGVLEGGGPRVEARVDERRVGEVGRQVHVVGPPGLRDGRQPMLKSISSRIRGDPCRTRPPPTTTSPSSRSTAGSPSTTRSTRRTSPPSRSGARRILERKESMAFDWAWEKGQAKDERQFKILQSSPTLFWPELNDEPFRAWAVAVRVRAHGHRARVLVRPVPRQAARR